jgi:HK97 family phage prohead protease
MEYGMTHRVGAGGAAERYLRPDPVREIAQRMQRWISESETCKSCQTLPAMAIRMGVPLCSRCLDNRAIRFHQRPEGLAPRVVRAEDPDVKAPQFRGHMIVFNSRSVDLGGFIEIIKPSAADRLESERPDLRALWNHDSAIPLGRVTAGTMRARKVTNGVAVEIDPPRWAASYVETVNRRDVVGMSFGFIVEDDQWRMEDGKPLREVLDMHVLEGSPVSFPAYEATDLRVVQAGARNEWHRETETLHRIRLAR